MTEKKIFTIPNILSIFRIILVPVFVYYYVYQNNYSLAGLILIVSGITDLLDGYIARQFNQVSDLGKIIDPIADKLTQITVLVCLTLRFNNMVYPIIFEIAKDLLIAILGLLVIKKSDKVPMAKWHGKVSTFLLYALMIIHVFYYNIDLGLSNLMIFIVCAFILISLVLYAKDYIRILRS